MKSKALNTFVNFGHNLIFKSASIYTGILTLSKDKNVQLKYYEFQGMPEQEVSNHLSSLTIADFNTYKQTSLTSAPWVLAHSTVAKLLSKIKQPLTLGDIFDEILVGVQSGIDNIHVLKYLSTKSDNVLKLFSERANREIEIEVNLVKPFLRGEDVHRYADCTSPGLTDTPKG